MSDDLYRRLYLQLLSKLSGREVKSWASSKVEPAVALATRYQSRDIGYSRYVGHVLNVGVRRIQSDLTAFGGAVSERLRWALSRVEHEEDAFEEGASVGDVEPSKLIDDDEFQYMDPPLVWWWPDPAEGYIDENAYLFLSRMPMSGPSKELTKYEASAKDLYSTYWNMLLRAPKVVVGANGSQSKEDEDWNSQYQTALSASEKPSDPSEDKPGFVKMTTHAGTILAANFVVADGKDWISELKKKAEEEDAKEGTYSPGGDSGLIGILQNISLHVNVGSSPLVSSLPIFLPFNIPTPSDPFFAVFTSSNKWETFDIPLDDGSISITVGAIGRVPVQPDPHWYDSDYLQTLAKRDSWNPPYTTEIVFGKKGLLSQRINGFIAAYHVTFEVTVSPKTFKKLQPIFDSALGFRIGPFEFGEGIFSRIPRSALVPRSPMAVTGSWKHQASAETKSFDGEGIFSRIPRSPLVPQPPITGSWKHQANPKTKTFEGSSADCPVVIGVTVERILRDDDDVVMMMILVMMILVMMIVVINT